MLTDDILCFYSLCVFLSVCFDLDRHRLAKLKVPTRSAVQAVTQQKRAVLVVSQFA